MNGIQSFRGSIPLISTKSSAKARKTLKSLDFKVFSYPKVEKSQYSLFVPVRLIFDGNFENQEVRYYEENEIELRRHHGGNLFGFPHFPQSKGLADKTLQSYEQQFRAVARHLDVKTDMAIVAQIIFSVNENVNGQPFACA